MSVSLGLVSFFVCFCDFLTRLSLFVIGLVILCFFCVLFVSCLVVCASAIDCLERPVPEMAYYMSSGTLNVAHSLTLHIQRHHLPN